MAALVGDGGVGGHQLADARAVDISNFLQIQQDLFVILLHQFPKGVAQGARPLSESDPASHIDYGDVTDLTISQLYAHGKNLSSFTSLRPRFSLKSLPFPPARDGALAGHP